jgi:transitional endoplasmic reticulum ATPase
MNSEIILTPSQQKAFNGLLEGACLGDVLVLTGDAGMGKTTILEKLRATRGGVILGAREFLAGLMPNNASGVEEAFLRMIEDAMQVHDLVIVDDLQLVTNITDSRTYPRQYLLDAALTALLAEARVMKKRLVFAGAYGVPWPVERRAYSWEIEDFEPEDYRQICLAHLPEGVALDFARIHRFAPGLDGHQLVNSCTWMGRAANLNTETFLDYLREHHMTSNVEIDEVQPVKWTDLRGVDDVIRALEAKVALPFENDDLSSKLRLKPKRGVLLAGPPGTGKTTIGRALAHRLKSKFFLIDGTVVAGASDFYTEVKEIFENARRNAPSVVFIDDTDVIFDGGRENGFYRYLLTLLDGLESASSERVCVMMTAMNPGSLPPAMLRSGRVELWLETRLPDAAAREQILRDRLAGIDTFGTTDLSYVAEKATGLTGADLKAVVEDAKLLFAHDVSTGTPARPLEEYFVEAIGSVRANHRSYGKYRPVTLGEPQKMGFSAALE